MPTYVYQCSTCQKQFEVEQRITEDPLKDCQCGAKNSLKRLIQPTAVMFKGAGFHINDYAPSPAAAGEAGTGGRGDGGMPAADCTGEPASCPTCTTAET